MPEPLSQPLQVREEIAQYLLSYGIEPFDLELEPDPDQLPAEAALAADLGIPFPDGLAPVPQPIEPAPDTSDALPQAEIVVITWTVAEQNALCDVMTPGFGRARWYRYNRNFAAYAPKIRGHAPAANAQRLGSYFPTKIGNHTVLCMKSELHLNQDGISTGPGRATLPVKDFFNQIIDEVQPQLIITAGTSGSVKEEFTLGDVVVTRAAKFRCQQEFRNEPFNNQTYKSEWDVPSTQFAKAEELMARFSDELTEPPVGPPTGRYTPKGPALQTPANTPRIRLELESRDMPEFHPILTTDYFEYGTTTNNLFSEGAAVEMGDAALGLACSERDNPPDWLVCRNMSDPLINGELPTREFHLNEQTMWAVGYYTAYGYYTSVTGALAAWAVIAGLE
jgi:nucleoside phosphorylase